MRFLLAVVAFLSVGTGGVFAYHQLTAGPPVVLPVPAKLSATSRGAPLMPGGWTNSSRIALKGMLPAGIVAGFDVEVVPEGQRFANRPTMTTGFNGGPQAACRGALHCSRQSLEPAVNVRLPDGRYEWQARLHNTLGVSPWRVYRNGIGVDRAAPDVEQLTSSTNPDPLVVYHSSTLRFDWAGNDSGAGVSGYSYQLDSHASSVPKEQVRTTSTNVSLAGLDTGKWYFHVRALDRAGNWGTARSFPVRIDVTPPGLAHVRFNLFGLNPQYDSLSVAFQVTRPATQVRVGVYRQSDHYTMRTYTLKNLPQGKSVSLDWHGRDSQQRLGPPGNYEVYIRATDQYGHSSLTGWRDFSLNYKRIVISLGRQRMWAYDHGRVYLTSLVTTGNRKLPTPTGQFHILGRLHPFTFHSPWPPSSPYYYPPSKVSYAMPFKEGGYFIHDAPWRNFFGPGSNSALGTPGSSLTGTHGCVNIPENVAAQLFAWAENGTVVQVVR